MEFDKNSIEVEPGAETYKSYLRITANVTWSHADKYSSITVKENVAVIVTRKAYYVSNNMLVRIETSYQYNPALSNLDPTRLEQVEGLREAIVSAAKQHWAKFAATDAEVADWEAGKYDELVSLTVPASVDGVSVLVTITDMPFAGYKLSGEYTAAVTDDDRVIIHGDGVVRPSSSIPSNNYPQNVPETGHAGIIALLRPIVERKLAGVMERLMAERRADLGRWNAKHREA